MRPFRFLLTLISCIAAFFLLLYIGPWKANPQEDLEERGSIGAYFNWRTPSSLFPPSAIISLTDDNSTFFLARPAAFGPVLPQKSLSGRLWIGSGFGADHLGRAGYGAEGELGCSDVPGWNDGSYVGGATSLKDAKSSWSDSQEFGNGSKRKRDLSPDESEDDLSEQQMAEDDGTDDHLHHPLPASDAMRSNGQPARDTKKPSHADIQSLQEGAEIAGKVVLLSRGGCGFLEKVKWVQRRGGVALVVGDDVRGGPLVTMYARGDTSNVTIPSLFTAHTTAHLLSSLIPPKHALDGISHEEAERLGLVFGDQSEHAAQKDGIDGPTFTTTSVAIKSTPTIKSSSNGKDEETNIEDNERKGWFGSMFGSRSKDDDGEARRPPSSGDIGWMLQHEFDEDDDQSLPRVGGRSSSTKSSPSAPTPTPDHGSSDGFVIGVQDWRDPDLVAQHKEQLLASTSISTSTPTAQSSKGASTDALKGGSITPGSGEYAKDGHEAAVNTDLKRNRLSESSASDQAKGNRKSGNWFGHFFHSQDQQPTVEIKSKGPNSKTVDSESRAGNRQADESGDSGADVHEGLWVTLTPASMSSSPFFDTLLVLVVSPLVTLTVVYALLLLRSRIRRRRWRAPKSVVERLPVRTYQTMPTTAPPSSTTSSVSSPVTASTPLLPSSARPINGRPRPRSRTASEVPVQPSSSMRSDEMASPSLEQVEEKRAAGLAEWRRRYGSKQRECVVCLEEYVDGVSRVMSLPCGHEFHAECITPWLTTRRRTCPICKGDVVRSLARSSGSTSGSPDQPFPDDGDSDDVQEQVAVTRNDDPAAAQPVSREDEAFEDLERGMGPDRTR